MGTFEERIRSVLMEGIRARSDEQIIPDIARAATLIQETLRAGNKILICGNGGSASQSDHFAGEIVGKFESSWKPFPCISLTNPILLTPIANDKGFEHVFSQQVEAYGKEGDVLIVITTSDYDETDNHSMNLKNALDVAKEKGLKTIGLYSIKSQKIPSLTDIPIKVYATNTARIQEMHITILHLLASAVDDLR